MKNSRIQNVTPNPKEGAAGVLINTVMNEFVVNVHLYIFFNFIDPLKRHRERCHYYLILLKI